MKTLPYFPVRGVYFRKFNPLLFTRLGLPRTRIMPKHSEGVLWAQNKGHFWTQHPWKPLCRLLVWPYLRILNFFIFYFFELSAQLRGTTRDLSWVVGGMYAPVPSGQKHALLWLESQGMPIISLLKLIVKCKLTLFFSQKATRISMKRLSNDDNWFVCPSSKLYQSQRSSYWVIRWYRSANLSRKNQLKLNQNETKRSSFLSLVFYIQLFRQHIQSSNLRQSRDSSWIQLCIASCAKLLLPASLFTANWFMAIISYFSLQLNSPVSLLKTLRRRVSLPFLSMPHTLHKRFHTASIFGIVQISKYYPNIP